MVFRMVFRAWLELRFRCAGCVRSLVERFSSRLQVERVRPKRTPGGFTRSQAFTGEPLTSNLEAFGERPGVDLGFDPLGLAPEDPAELAEMREKELAHCRLAMIAAAGFLAQEAVTGATWGTAYGLPDF